jgi:hypothetical protein
MLGIVVIHPHNQLLVVQQGENRHSINAHAESIEALVFECLALLSSLFPYLDLLELPVLIFRNVMLMLSFSQKFSPISLQSRWAAKRHLSLVAWPNEFVPYV